MSKRSITIAEYKTVEQPVPDKYDDREKTRVVEVSVGYEEGGASYFSGNVTRRGYFLHVTVQTVAQHDGYQMKSFELFNSGLKGFIAEAARFSQKQLEKHAAAALDSELFDRVLTKVLVSKDLHIEDERVTAAIHRCYETIGGDELADRQAAREAEEARKEKANRGGR